MGEDNERVLAGDIIIHQTTSVVGY